MPGLPAVRVATAVTRSGSHHEALGHIRIKSALVGRLRHGSLYPQGKGARRVKPGSLVTRAWTMRSFSVLPLPLYPGSPGFESERCLL